MWMASAFCAFPHASITKASFTEMHTISSTPFALILSALATKPGRWAAEQVGVNAPGTANITTFLPPNSSSLPSPPGPLSVMWARFTLGTLSPTLIVIVIRPRGC